MTATFTSRFLIGFTSTVLRFECMCHVREDDIMCIWKLDFFNMSMILFRLQLDFFVCVREEGKKWETEGR